MKKVLITIFTVLLLLLLLAGAAIYYFKFVVYPLDKDGMIWNENENKSYQVEITLDENPSTGFLWKYEVYPEGAMEIVVDRYESDQKDSEEAIEGAGGVHFYGFKVLQSGPAEIRFIRCRGDEVLYESEIIYQYECDGDNTRFVNKTVTNEMKIENLSVEWRGGFGTRAGTHPISVDFTDGKVSLKASLDEYNGKEATELTQEIDMNSEDVEEILEMVKHNLWDIRHNTYSNNDVLDAGNEYITINGEVYGGYAPEGEGFNEVVKAVYDAVGRDRIKEFRSKIFEWYEETE